MRMYVQALHQDHPADLSDAVFLCFDLRWLISKSDFEQTSCSSRYQPAGILDESIIPPSVSRATVS